MFLTQHQRTATDLLIPPGIGEMPHAFRRTATRRIKNSIPPPATPAWLLYPPLREMLSQACGQGDSGFTAHPLEVTRSLEQHHGQIESGTRNSSAPFKGRGVYNEILKEAQACPVVRHCRGHLGFADHLTSESTCDLWTHIAGPPSDALGDCTEKETG
jgi:hypothetical protein